jgi:isopenicillin-N epimerase
MWKEFDWQGTLNPTAFLALPEAIRVIGGLEAGGWPAHMAANRALAQEARTLLNDRLGLAPIAPDSMVGSMASVRLPGVLDEDGANVIARSLAAEDRIEVPLVAFPVRAAREPGAGPTATLLRISAQRYNELGDYERLADALVRRGLAAAQARPAAAPPASAIVAG